MRKPAAPPIAPAPIVYVIDDDPSVRAALEDLLASMGLQVRAFASTQAFLEHELEDAPACLVLDVRMPGQSGLEFHRTMGSHGLQLPVVFITGHGDMHTAVEALRKGAYDYLAKPINARELAAVVERSAEHQALLLENKDLRQNLDARVDKVTGTLKADLEKVRSRLKRVVGIGNVVAQAPAMRRAMDEARIFHRDPTVPVLLEGETGTGKEVLARLIHYGDTGTETPFVAINCAAIPHDLFEAELFGHEEGAYTGSRSGG